VPIHTVSRRGVVFFKNQDLTPEGRKTFTDKIGRLAGKPESSTMHIHPLMNSERKGEFSAVDAKGTINTDDTISVISSTTRKALYENNDRNGADEWHSGEWHARKEVHLVRSSSLSLSLADSLLLTLSC
jgi:alpha-ketoglutarate-dependent taurine dioxygenase